MSHSARCPSGVAVLALLALSACGGGGGPTASSPPPGPRTATFMGTTWITAGVCTSSGNHEFAAGEGTLVVTLVQATSSPMAVQVCHVSAVDHTTCTIPPFASLPVGQSLSAPLRGGRTTQRIAIYPESCGRPGTLVPTPELSYTVTVSYPG